MYVLLVLSLAESGRSFLEGTVGAWTYARVVRCATSSERVLIF